MFRTLGLINKHKEMDEKLEKIEKALNSLVEKPNQYEVIQAVTPIKKMLIEIFE